MSVDVVGCKNPAPAGPFGGCAAVQMGGTTEGNNTTDVNSATGGNITTGGNSTTASDRKIKRIVGLIEYKRRGILARLEG